MTSQSEYTCWDCGANAPPSTGDLVTLGLPLTDISYCCKLLKGIGHIFPILCFPGVSTMPDASDMLNWILLSKTVLDKLRQVAFLVLESKSPSCRDHVLSEGSLLSPQSSVQLLYELLVL